MNGPVVWHPHDSRPERPPLDEPLTGWDVHHRRRSHLNASRVIDGRAYHLKWFFKRPFSGNPARREFENARRVKDLGIPSVVAVGWGTHPRGTFFVMEGSPGRSIYDLPERPDPETLRRMSVELGEMVARLHNARLCHRDLYVDHVLIDGETLRLIDLGRVLRFRRRRWIIKDLGGLLFSAWREHIPSPPHRAFLRSYLRHSRHAWHRKKLITAIRKKAQSYWRHNVRTQRIATPEPEPR